MADSTYHGLLEEKAKKLGDKIFLRFEDERISYRELDQKSNQVANALHRLGVGPGVGVANMIPNSPETLYAHFAIQKLGAYTVPINTELKGDHLVHILNHSDAQVLLLHNDLHKTFRAVSKQCPKIKHVAVSFREASPILKAFPGVEVIQEWLFGEVIDRPAQTHRDGDVAMILYTSGTTGQAKGVVYRYGRLGLDRVGLAAKLFYQPTDVLYTCLPLFHANALYVTLPSALIAEAGLAISRRFSASHFWDEVRKLEATEFNALGAMIPILMKQPEGPNDADNPVRIVLSAACPAALWQKFEKRFGLKLLEFYGAVDGGGNAVFNLGNAPVGSIGPLPKPNARVVDENMNDVAPGVPGELIFQMPEKERPVEYYKDEDAGASKQRGGWLHTGDLVYRDEKDFLYFVDRKSDNMRRRGENISSYEVEKIVEKHPTVLEAAAYAIKSDLGEDDVMVAVTPKPGASVNPAELYDFCVEQMPRYMVPRFLRVVDAFEMTETHRVKKAPLREQGVTPDTWDEEKERGRRK